MPGIREWLNSHGLSEYADRFAQNRIDLSILPDLTDDDLKERLLTWDLLKPGRFKDMLEERTRKIHQRALALFGMTSAQLEALFA